MCRCVDSLAFAKYSRSPFAGSPRSRGKKAAGKRYEREVGKELARRGLDVAIGPWIEFCDKNGKGFAQPDFVVFAGKASGILLEAKLSQTPAAFEQLFSLYLPLLAFLHPEIEFVPVQVCKNLRTGGDIIEDLDEARPGATWHWLA